MRYPTKWQSSHLGWIIPLAVSLLLKGFLSLQDVVLNSDGVVYLEAARMIAEGHFSQSLLLYPMPAYPLLIATAHLIVPDWILAAKLINVIAAAAITLPVYWLTQLLFDRRAAFYAALAVALLPKLNDMAPDVIRDPCFLLLACGSVAWMVEAFTMKRIRGVLGAFALAGAALLFRIEAISLFMVYLLYLAGVALVAKEQRRFARKALLVVLIPALLGMVGLVGVGATSGGADRVDQLQAFGRSILDGRFFSRYQDIYAHLKDSERLSPGTSGELFKLARHYLPLLCLVGMLEAFFKGLFWPNAVLLWIARRRVSTGGMPLVLLTIIIHSLLVLIYFLRIDYLSSRYLLFCALLTLPLVGQGAVLLEGKAQRVTWRKTALALIVLVFVAFPLYRSVVQGFGEDRAIAMTGRWLSHESELRRVPWAVNDLRYYIYAGKPLDLQKEEEGAIKVARYQIEKNYRALEKLARDGGKDVIILRRRRKDPSGTVHFATFHKVKAIESSQSIITVYARNGLFPKEAGAHGEYSD